MASVEHIPIVVAVFLKLRLIKNNIVKNRTMTYNRKKYFVEGIDMD